jgi:hypothetical protein
MAATSRIGICTGLADVLKQNAATFDPPVRLASFFVLGASWDGALSALPHRHWLSMSIYGTSRRMCSCLADLRQLGLQQPSQ